MLKKENRLTTTFEFNVTRKYGQRFYGFYFSGNVVKPTKYSGPTKVGIVVSNKIHKSAAKRNRIKRLFRQTVMENLDRMGISLWWSIYPKIVCLGADYEKISSDFNKALQKISLPN